MCIFRICVSVRGRDPQEVDVWTVDGEKDGDSVVVSRVAIFTVPVSIVNLHSHADGANGANGANGQDAIAIEYKQAART